MSRLIVVLNRVAIGEDSRRSAGGLAMVVSVTRRAGLRGAHV
ncbi:hypothetical protein [Burkholderia sp. Ac-20353]|nr:hypothetical protein [Burkholderia sp. Ac-20353]